MKKVDLVMIGDLLPPKEIVLDGHTWGGWKYLQRTMELVYVDRDYYVNLEKLNTSAKVLDVLVQIGLKSWGTHAVGDLILALYDIIDPQSNLCSNGRSKRIAKADLVSMLQRTHFPRYGE